MDLILKKVCLIVLETNNSKKNIFFARGKMEFNLCSILPSNMIIEYINSMNILAIWQYIYDRKVVYIYIYIYFISYNEYRKYIYTCQ